VALLLFLKTAFNVKFFIYKEVECGDKEIKGKEKEKTGGGGESLMIFGPQFNFFTFFGEWGDVFILEISLWTLTYILTIL
jgi:hypothetical protein